MTNVPDGNPGLFLVIIITLPMDTVPDLTATHLRVNNLFDLKFTFVRVCEAVTNPALSNSVALVF
jgi:hypothetical protein